MSTLLRRSVLLLLSLSLCKAPLANQVDAATQWTSVSSSDGSVATARHEAAAVAVGDNFYLMGGRGNRPLEVFNTINRRWRNLGNAPIELHHFQPVVIGQKIYALGAFTCCYPNEPSIAEIYVFDTVTELWTTDGVLPEARRRGAAAAVVHDGKIYLIGGNTLGHNGGAVAWFDSYDPATGNWQILDDAPHARDHFAAAVINGRLIAAAGRRTFQPNPFVFPVLATDIYNFSTGNWTTGADIPTPRAGTMIATAGDELLVAGGEIESSSQALRTTEAYNVLTNQWRSLQPMIDPRHSGGGAVINDMFHVVAGSNVKGGPLSGELSRQESLDLTFTPVTDVDTDNDGLSDVDETDVYFTFPDDPDSDDDGLVDGREIDLGSDPLNSDSDADGLNDGAELAQGTGLLDADSDDDELSDGLEISLNSDPLDPDSDSDGLDDGAEHTLGSNLLNPDTDSEGLSDGEEVSDYSTNPLLADTDSDELSDFAEVTLWLTDPLLADSDNDGLLDGAEIALGTLAGTADTDADGIVDGVEVVDGTDPLKQDTDDDGLLDGVEIALGTLPGTPDTDADGIVDGQEVVDGTDPLKQDTDNDGLNDAEDPDPLVANNMESGGKKSGLGALWWGCLAMGVVALSRKRSIVVKYLSELS